MKAGKKKIPDKDNPLLFDPEENFIVCVYGPPEMIKKMAKEREKAMKKYAKEQKKQLKQQKKHKDDDPGEEND